MKLVIFGCGNISRRIAKSCKLVKEIDLVGFGSRDIAKAKQYAEEYEDVEAIEDGQVAKGFVTIGGNKCLCEKSRP